MDFLELRSVIVTSLTAIKCRIENNTGLVQPRDFHSLSFRLSGDTELLFDGKRVRSKAGDITYVPKGKNYSQLILKPTEIIALHFTLSEEKDTEIQIIKPENGAEISRIFDALHQYWQRNPVSGNINCMYLMYKILSKLNRNDDNTTEYKKSRILEPAVEYIKNYYTKEDLSISYLSNLCGVSEAYFRRLFEGSFGCSPIRYIKSLRIECAKRLLETGFYTIAEVAERSGYAGASYFCTDFRRETGITPKEYSSLAGI